MHTREYRLRAVVFLATLATLLVTSLGAPEPERKLGQIPEALKPWQEWATWGDKQRDCPSPYSDPKTHFCFWPSQLSLDLQNTGGRFDLSVTVYSEAWVPLPGSSDRWPGGVTSDGVPIAVVEHERRPSVQLSPGLHRLQGSYRWTDLPENISLPPEIGVLTLKVGGAAVEAPTWDPEGLLWLRRSATTEEKDAPFLSRKIYAQLEDGNPLWLRVAIELQVSGKSREEDLGIVLPEGWRPTNIVAPIPVALDATGRMKAQVRAGTWNVTIETCRIDNPHEIRFAEGAKPAASEILIGFNAHPEFRTLELAGATLVDVSQTTFPAEWRQSPVYRWVTAQPLKLEERMRGSGEQTPAGLTIRREWWLDEDGRAMTFRDNITGSRQRIWRLDAMSGEALGAVRSKGQGQLITRNQATGAAGVELRSRSIDLEATGRMNRASTLPASGWNTDAEDLKVTLNLPPGWRLFALFGADWVHGAWLTSWTLLDLFLLLIFTLAVHRMYGIGAAVLAFAAFGIAYHEPGAPRFVWLALLVPVALLRVVPEGRGRLALLAAKWAAVAVLVVLLVPFVAQQTKQGLYPQLEDTAPYQAQSVSPARDLTATEALPASPPAEALSGVDRTRRKLENIIIPKLELREASVRTAIDFLHQQSVLLDTQERDPAKRGVEIKLKVGEFPKPDINASPVIPGLEAVPGHPPAMSSDSRITVSLSNIPLGEALRYVSGLSNLKLKLEEDGVSIVPQGTPTENLLTKEFKVGPGFLSAVPDDQSGTRGGSGISRRAEAKDFLAAQGVAFPPGSSAIYLPSTGKLIVRNTQENVDLMDAIVEASQASSPAGEVAPELTLQYDPTARIQTGPAVPEWSWRPVSFGWNGPVQASQEVHPLLISSGLERVLTALRILLLLALAAVLLGARALTLPRFRFPGKSAAVLICLLFVNASGARAQFPEQSMLEKLRERLLEHSDAYPTAADIPSATLHIAERRIVIDAEIHAATRTAVPLPGQLPSWSPTSVLLDDKPESALRRDDSFLWIVVEAGVHKVRVEGMLANAGDWQWSFLLTPHQVTVDAPDWTVSGISPDGVPEQQVFLVKKEKAASAEATYERPDLQTLLQVERRVSLGLTWDVQTTVKRLSPPGKPVAIRIPLLPGESVLTSPADVKDGAIEVRLGAQESSSFWVSSLAIADRIKLTTRAEDTWVERWQLVAQPVWNVTLSGLPPIYEPDRMDLSPVWQPWPGEAVEIAVSRPKALDGATMTLRKADHEITLGQRQRTAHLALTLRSSLGEDFILGLAGGADVTALTQDGKALPVRKDNGRLVIPLHPGEQTLVIESRYNTPLGFHTAADTVHLPVDSANVTTVINVPQDRWILWAHGPLRGPAVRFWGILLGSLLAALILSRLPASPLRIAEWMLLLIGLTQVPLVAALVVVGWLFLLGWRGTGFQGLRPWLFNVVQLFLILLTATALGVLLWSVGEGLLGNPEMFIAGNGSTRTSLRWFQPQSGTALPQPGLISVSIWWFRLLMLLWALWLAAALMRWLRWGWENFSRGGTFRRKPAVDTPPPLAGRTSA